MTEANSLFSSKIKNPHYDDIYDIDPKELYSQASAKSGDVTMIDVRQPDEYVGELGHIEEAQLMVLDTLPERLSEIPKDKTIVFVCRSGARSARAAAFAKQNGYNDVYNMLGGMLLWNELRLPTTTNVKK